MDGLFITEIASGSGQRDFDRYPFSLPAVRCLDRLRLDRPVTFFSGENGSGKSTLLEAIAVNCGFNPEGGSRNFNFATMATHSELCEHIRLIKGIKRPKTGFFFRAESFYNVATEIIKLDEPLPGMGAPVSAAYGGRSLHEMSHGESFLALIKNRFADGGLYILDEPEAALSPSGQMALLARLHELVRGGCQFLIATHSPVLLSYPDAAIYVLRENEIRLTPYRETECYTLTRQFLNNPEGLLQILLEK